MVMASFASQIREAIQQYERLGYDTLPLPPGAKKEPETGWPGKLPAEMWSEARADANIGLRCGGERRLGVIDCDENAVPGTFRRSQNLLEGLGYTPGTYPVVQTASGVGRHIYVELTEKLPGHWRKFSASFGAGEFRYGPGSYAVAPPSRIKGAGAYEFICGDLRLLPRLAPEQIRPILNDPSILNPRAPPRCNIPRRTKALLEGDYVDSYPSRSEAEQAIIVGLINAGHDFQCVMTLFSNYPAAGKFTELHTQNPNAAVRWLRRSYENAKNWAEAHESLARQQARRAIAWAESRSWQGRTGISDRPVFIAHAKIALRASRLVYAASARDLAELAGVTFQTASNATSRMCNARLLELVKPASGRFANVYRFAVPASFDTSSPQAVRKCQFMQSLGHDAFRWRGLGKSAHEVWTSLREEPATVHDLVEKTGRHANTVERALARMNGLIDPSTGEIIEMAWFDGELWHANDVDLGRIARIVGTAGKGRQQKTKHAEERRAHRRALRSDERR
jgi:hypothetical protein